LTGAIGRFMRKRAARYVLVPAALCMCAAVLARHRSPVPSTAAGRDLFESTGCTSCHGLEGRGDGPLSVRLPVRPINLRDRSAYQQGTTETAIAETIAEGVSIVYTDPGEDVTHHQYLMPEFYHLTDVERRSLALYVISLQAK
jgi:hypothetical protein